MSRSLVSALAVLAACTLPTAASPAREGLELKLTLEVDSTRAACERYPAVRLDMKNADPNRVTVTDVATDEVSRAVRRRDGVVVMAPEPVRLLVEPARLDIGRPMRSGETVSGRLSLETPRTDGAYREVVRAGYEYAREAHFMDPEVEHDSEATLYYEVRRGCATQISPERYDGLVDIRSRYTQIWNGIVQTVVDVEGPADFDIEPDDLSPVEEVAVPLEIVTARSVHLNDDDLAAGGTGPVPVSSSVLDLRYCFKARFRSHFKSIPSNKTGMSWWRPQWDGGKVPMLGLVVELWDRDSESSDDLIGTWIIYHSDIDTYTCLNYEWDQSARGEDYPDPYLRTNFIVADPEHDGNNRRAVLCASDQSGTSDWCTDRYYYTWRSSYYSNQKGKIYEKKTFGDKTGTWNRRAMSISTVQKFLRGWEGFHMTGDLNVWWDGDRCKNDDGDRWPCN